MDPESEPIERPAHAFNNLVQQSKSREWEGDDWYGISLSDMWRSAGLPADHNPEQWAFLNRDYFKGSVGFIRAVHPHRHWPDDPPRCPPGRIDIWSYGLLDQIKGTGSDFMCYGDITTDFEPIAAAYAMFLDEALLQTDPPLLSLAEDVEEGTLAIDVANRTAPSIG